MPFSHMTRDEVSIQKLVAVGKSQSKNTVHFSVTYCLNSQ